MPALHCFRSGRNEATVHKGVDSVPTVVTRCSPASESGHTVVKANIHEYDPIRREDEATLTGSSYEVVGDVRKQVAQIRGTRQT
jgi:hypothetical protein